MKDMIEKIKQKTGNADDMIYKEIDLKGKKVYLVFDEVLTSSSDVNDFVLKNFARIIDFDLPVPDDLYAFFYNSLPSHNVKEVTDEADFFEKIYNGFVILIENPIKCFGMEMKADLDRGISDAKQEISVRGPKEAFTENYNKNLGLLRRRIKSESLFVDSLTIGKESKTKIGICYMENIAEQETVQKVKKQLNEIAIDGILDSAYLREELSTSSSLFPTLTMSERPDVASMALLEGKVVVLVDMTPYVLILPCFFIDFFHTPDDYYQKPVNITFIRIIRLLAFFISIFIPAYYIAITTHNHDAISIDLLINFAGQRANVPFPALVEALLMTISFEILRESDLRMASTVGSAVSILGGLVLGDAAVSAGIISPIMIIVVAISAISGLVYPSLELTSAVRWWRIGLLILSATLGIYGIFLGGLLLIVELTSIKSFGKPYLAPFAPLVVKEQRDAILKLPKEKVQYRNPYLTNKNKVRGRKASTK